MASAARSVEAVAAVAGPPPVARLIGLDTPRCAGACGGLMGRVSGVARGACGDRFDAGVLRRADGRLPHGHRLSRRPLGLGRDGAGPRRLSVRPDG
ncbi:MULTISPECIES: hypothetical protein [Methylobacterium]|uniref:hypothetical protein n=1 Tax=Methylobacterium TaxID=407 RepID=UPI00338E74A8